MIYLCITPFFPDGSSFRGPFIYDQVKAVERTKLFDRVLVLKPSGLLSKKKSYQYQGIDVYLFSCFFLPSMFFDGLFDRFNQWLLRRFLRSMGVNERDISVVHAHTASYAHYACDLAKRNPKVHSICQYHCPDPLQVRLGRIRNRFYLRWLARKRVKILSDCHWHIGVSQLVLDQLSSFPQTTLAAYTDYLYALRGLEKIPNVKIKNSYVLYNGVDCHKFFSKPIQSVELSGCSRGRSASNTAHVVCEHKDRGSNLSKRFIVGCIGNFVDWKGQMTLLRAVARLVQGDPLTGDKQALCSNQVEGVGGGIPREVIQMDLEVCFVGSGPKLKECRQFVESNGLCARVKFLSEVDHTQLRDFYYSLDLFVLPSFFEGFGCVYLEAWACGVPFICCKGQGISEYILEEDQDKWMFPPEDYRALAEKIYHYYEYRWPQQLKHPVDIDILVGHFLQKIK